MEWTGARYADCPRVEVSTVIDASPAQVWPLVSDIELMPSMSEELQAIEWLDGAGGPAVGVRFRGYSAHPDLGSWSAPARITAWDPPTGLSWEVESDAAGVPSASWSFRLIPDGDGRTRLTQTATMGPGRSGLSLAIDRMPDKEQRIVFVRLREFEAGMTATLETIKLRAEQAPGAGST